MFYALTFVFILTSIFIIFVLYFPIIYPDIAIENVSQNEFSLSNNLTHIATNKNPFKPKISTIIDLGNNHYWVIIEDYERSGMFSIKPTGQNNGKDKEIDFGAIDAEIKNYTLSEVKDLVAKVDLSKENPNSEKITTRHVKTDQKRVTNQDHYYSIPESAESNSNLFDKKFVKNDTISEIEDVLGLKSFRGVCTGFASNECERHYKIENEEKFYIAFAFDEKYLLENGSSNPGSKLQKIYIIKNDRSYIEVLIKEDGTFDFDLAFKEISQ